MSKPRGSSNSTLWMGDLEYYMDEQFIQNAYTQLGEAVKTVHIPKNKGGAPGQVGYCFVEFDSPYNAQKAMLRLNGKVVPGTVPPRRFKLNISSFGREHTNTPEYSLFVGELSEDVDDFALHSCFSKKYPSCKAAKVVLDSYGTTRGYGFIRFTDEDDQLKAMKDMDGYQGLGRRALRVQRATPRRGPRQYDNNSQYGNQGNQYYNQQGYGNQGNQQGSGWWQGYNQSYYQYPDGQRGAGDKGGAPDGTNMPTQGYSGYQADDDDDPLEDPELEIDIEKANKEFYERSEEFYVAMEGSRWHPLDNVLSSISNEPIPVAQ